VDFQRFLGVACSCQLPTSFELFVSFFSLLYSPCVCYNCPFSLVVCLVTKSIFHSSWLLAKDLSRLQPHEIESYITGDSKPKKIGDLLEGYKIAKDPRDWEAAKQAAAEAAAAAAAEEDDADGDGEEEDEEDGAGVDELDSEGGEGGGEKKKAQGKKRKRESEAKASGSKKANAKPKKEKAPAMRKKAPLGGTGKKGPAKKKSKANVESEDEGGKDGEGEIDPDVDGGASSSAPPAKKLKVGEDDDRQYPCLFSVFLLISSFPAMAQDPEAVRVREWRSKVQKMFLPSTKEKDKDKPKEAKILSPSVSLYSVSALPTRKQLSPAAYSDTPLSLFRLILFYTSL
jgi:hypothetical protein